VVWAGRRTGIGEGKGKHPRSVTDSSIEEYGGRNKTLNERRYNRRKFDTQEEVGKKTLIKKGALGKESFSHWITKKAKLLMEVWEEGRRKTSPDRAHLWGGLTARTSAGESEKESTERRQFRFRKPGASTSVKTRGRRRKKKDVDLTSPCSERRWPQPRRKRKRRYSR